MGIYQGYTLAISHYYDPRNFTLLREITSFEEWKSTSQIVYSYVKPDGRSSGKRRNPDFHDLVLWQKSHATCLKIS